MILDYGLLNEKRDRLRLSYPDEHIDTKKDLHVVLFIPAKNSHFMSALTQINFVVDVYTYMFVRSGAEEGIVLDQLKISSNLKPRAGQYDSMLRVMGENVRSEHSQVPPKKDFSSGQSNVKEKQKDENLQTSVPQQDISISKVRDIAEKASLSEEELIAFFDLEKKVDSYCNISRNNPEK
jgi:hypothetical protein